MIDQQGSDLLTDDELLAIADDPTLKSKLTPTEMGRLSQLRGQGSDRGSGPVGRFVENAVQPLAQAPGMMLKMGESLLPTEGGAAARQELGRSIVEPSVERMNMAAQATREGRPLAALGNAAAAVPIVGPAVAHGVEQMRSGDVAGGAGTLTGVAAPFVAGPAARGAGAALKGTRVGEGLADMADASATSRMVDVMAPKVGANKVRFGAKAEEVAPALARDPTLSAYSREGLQAGVETRLAEAEAGLDAAAQNRNPNLVYHTRPILRELQKKRDRMTAQTVQSGNVKAGENIVPAPNGARVAMIDQAMQEIEKLGPIASFESLRRIREAYDGPAKAKYSESMTADYLKAQGGKTGAADVTSVLREKLAGYSPETADANAAYTLYRNAHDVLEAAAETERVRPRVGRGLMTRATGGVVGAMNGGTAGGIIGVLVGEIATRAAQMAPTFQIVIARRLAAAADALRAGNPAGAQQIVQNAITKFPAVKSGLKISGQMTPAATVSGLPRAADSDPSEHR
jgi:hypothetical protein